MWGSWRERMLQLLGVAGALAIVPLILWLSLNTPLLSGPWPYPSDDLLVVRREARVRAASGVVTHVDAGNDGRARAVTLRTEEGRELRFDVDALAGVTVAELLEHMADRDRVTVYYRGSGGGRAAVKVVASER
jgi:hypothetical protein